MKIFIQDFSRTSHVLFIVGVIGVVLSIPVVTVYPEFYHLIASCILIGSSFTFHKASRKTKVLNRILESSPLMILILDLSKDRINYVNPHIYNSLGYPATGKELLQGSFQEMIHPEDRNLFTGTVKALQESPQDLHIISMKYRFLRMDGSYAFVRSKVMVFKRADHNEPRELLFLSEDISNEHALETQLEAERVRAFKNEKLTALGEMAGGMAHEINNPVAIILGYTQSIRKRILHEQINEADLVRMTDKIESTAKRISKIVNSLKMVASDGLNDAFINTPVQTLIDDMSAFWAQRLQNNQIEFKIDPFDPMLTTYCRPVQIVLVFLNLLSNSFHAIKDHQEKWIRVSVSEAGDDVEIRLTDSGHGISKEVQEKIFQPFFTTRNVNMGRGLGLSVAAGIMRVHSGSISIDNNSSNTCFVVRVPKGKAQIYPMAA